MTLLPAVDVKGGQAVQLVQGVDGTEKVFGDPIKAARRWQDGGADWLHVVDLDAAFGRDNNLDVIRRLIEETDLQVELSGGIRDDASLERALATGCTRVNIGTAALENPEWCEQIIARHRDRIAISLDVKGDKLAARGWTSEGGNVFETLARLDAAGCRRYVVTDVASDGMLTGPNYEVLGAICARTESPVVASGGISTLEDLRRLRGLVPIGIEGAIVGTALYVGNFTLAEALAVARGDDSAARNEDPHGADRNDQDQTDEDEKDEDAR